MLVRQGNVQPFAARVPELPDGGIQQIRWHLQRFVLDVLAGLQGEQAVNDRRAAVGYRVSHDTISLNAVTHQANPLENAPDD